MAIPANEVHPAFTDDGVYLVKFTAIEGSSARDSEEVGSFVVVRENTIMGVQVVPFPRDRVAELKLWLQTEGVTVKKVE